MMSYGNYKRDHQHLTGNHQRISYKKSRIRYTEKNTKFLILTLRLTQNNPWVKGDYAAKIDLLNSPLMTDRADKNKVKIMMVMVI